MNDKEIRNILVGYLSATNKNYRIFQEKNIGSSICDVMLVTDKLCGFEIKSDSDNFIRLKKQTEAYNEFFDENTLVVGQTHLKEALAKTPEDWGIWCVELTQVKIIRSATKNKKTNIEKQLSILWKIELQNLLLKNSLPAMQSKPKEDIIKKLSAIPKKILKPQLIEELMTRDYSVFNAKDFTLKSSDSHGEQSENNLENELADALSENDLSKFTLDRWMEIYKKAFELRAKKEELSKKSIHSNTHKISYLDINVSLGVPWISLDIVKDFLREVFKLHKPDQHIYYEPITGHWSCDRCSFISNEINYVYGLPTYNAMRILEATLNMREVKIYSYGKYYEELTLAAREKQQKIIQAFQEWVWQDEDRKWEIEEAYNKIFASYGSVNYDGSKLSFNNISEKIKLYDYQKNAVQKIISTPNTLLAFEVGAGKTYVMIAAAMYMRQIGMSEKNLFVVPNNIVGQWETMFVNLYPQAKLLVVEPNSFGIDKRQKVLRLMRDGDFDGIIIAYSCFELIPLSAKYLTEKMKAEISKLQNEICNPKLCCTPNAAALANRQKFIKKSIEDFISAITPAVHNGVYFEELGINTIFLDEAHNYKNIPIKSSMKTIRGVNLKGSEKCLDMLFKVRCVQEMNEGRGAVFATGTPLSNSISDTYNMQVYLQHQELEKANLIQFDNWAKTFARIKNVCEIDVDTSSFRMVNKFSRFVNLPELSKMFSQIAVFHSANEIDLPEKCLYFDEVIEKSEELSSYMQSIYDRTEKIRTKQVTKEQDNMLKVSTDGRKAALSTTLVGLPQTYDKHNKIFVCANNVIELYNKYPSSCQIVFCDFATPSNKVFNVYAELKKLLKQKGIPDREIAFVHSYDKEEDRKTLFEKVNNGDIRILIGSTVKLGIGANVQQKLKALHHLDVPWRPADMVQREGRIIRRGNENDEIFIYRYIVKGSFDAYSWQILENKQKFISQFLSGTQKERSVEDLETQELNYAQVKALALDEPLMKEYTEKLNELRLAKIVMSTSNALKEHQIEEKQKLIDNNNYLRQKLEKTYINLQYIESIDINNHILEIENCARIISQNLFASPVGCIGNFLEFKMSVPQKQSKSKPSIVFERLGVLYHYVFGENIAGNVTRLKNFLKNFNEVVNKIKFLIAENDIKIKMLSQPDSAKQYSDEKIKLLEKQVAELFEKIKTKI